MNAAVSTGARDAVAMGDRIAKQVTDTLHPKPAFPDAPANGLALAAKRTDGPGTSQTIAPKQGAKVWATGHGATPADIGLVPTGVERGNEIYMRPEDTARYRASDQSVNSFPHLAVERNASGKTDPMSPSEANTIKILVGEGKQVTRLTASRIPGQQTHDYLVNGQRTELWTPTRVGSGTSSEKSIRLGIAEKVNQGGADHVIVDASRQLGLTRKAAVLAAKRSLDDTTNIRLKDVRIMGNEFDFTADRSTIRENGIK